MDQKELDNVELSHSDSNMYIILNDISINRSVIIYTKIKKWLLPCTHEK